LINPTRAEQCEAMTTPRALLLATLCLAVAACGQPHESRNMSDEEVAGQLQAMRIEPGLWELSSEVTDVSAPDLPHEVRQRMIGPRSRTRHCITPAQAEQPSANFLAGRAESECSYRDFMVGDGRIAGAMSCPDATARMRGTYGPAGYDMRMEMASPMTGGATMQLVVRSRGRRIGECEEGEKQ
jgi:hypothetical protein